MLKPAIGGIFGWVAARSGQSTPENPGDPNSFVGEPSFPAKETPSGPIPSVNDFFNVENVWVQKLLKARQTVFL